MAFISHFSKKMIFEKLKSIVILGMASTFICTLVLAQDPIDNEFPKGEVVEKVQVMADDTQRYALYLPKTYSPEKKWAILYSFDPLGRGRLPITIFKDSAEKYGFILVGSYNSQNGLDKKTLAKILNSLWVDTHQRLSIDEARVYATGFSGGARVASIFAASCRCVEGVIGSGAGFNDGLKPSPTLPFIYFNAIGVDDYNYYEIRTLKRNLEKVGATHRVERFDGAHQWLPKNIAENALNWMQLQAMKKGVLPHSEVFIEETYRSRISAAENLLSKKQFLEAFQSFSEIAEDFSDLRKVSDIKYKAERLGLSNELKRALRAEDDQISSQERHTSFLLSNGTRLLNHEERREVWHEIARYIADLQKIANKTEDSPTRRIARRSLNKVYAEAYETALFRYEREKRYELAMANYELANEIYPKNFRIPYDRARVYALVGQRGKALKYLEIAVELGFRGIKEMQTERAFERIHQDERFKKLLLTREGN